MSSRQWGGRTCEVNKYLLGRSVPSLSWGTLGTNMSPPSHVHQDAHLSHPTGPHSPQNASDPEPMRETGESRSRRSTGGLGKRSRSSSTPPNRGSIHDNDMQQRTSFFPVSADTSRAFAQNGGGGRTVGNVGIGGQLGSPATQVMARSDPRPRRSSVSHPPAPTPGRTSISSTVDRPVIPGVPTNTALVTNRLRRNSYQRSRILFYHRHEPHYGFTNFSNHPVEYQGKTYPTSEHLFQAFKVCGILSMRWLSDNSSSF
jgi:hypothetical protein